MATKTQNNGQPILTLDDLAHTPVYSEEQILRGDASKNLTVITKKMDGGYVQEEKSGRSVIMREADGKNILSEITKNGWMFFPVKQLDARRSPAIPESRDRTAVLHEKYRDATDIANKDQRAVLLPEMLLSFLYKDDGATDADFAKIAKADGFSGAVDNFLDNVLVINGFLPENVPEKKRLHSALEYAAKKIVAPSTAKELDQFQAAPYFANVRQEDLTPDAKFEDGMPGAHIAPEAE